MKSVKQLLRQPLKTGIGIILMTLAAAIVCLCVGQAVAAQTTKEALNQRFSTVGIPIVQEDLDGNVNQSSFELEDELLLWLEKMAAEHPDIIKQVSRHGIQSAYIPELTPVNLSRGNHFYVQHPWYTYQSNPDMMPYSCAMLVITLEEVSEPEPITKIYPVENLTQDDFATEEEYYEWLHTDPETEKITETLGYSVKITGTVTDVVSLPDGYMDPVGRVARLMFTAPTLEEVEALNLVPGEQYIVYGMDYVDEHWKLACALNPDGNRDNMDLEHFDPKEFRLLTEAEKKSYQERAEAFPDLLGHLKYLFAVYKHIYLTESEYLQLNSITMTLDLPVPLKEYDVIRDALTGELLQLQPKNQFAFTDAKGQTFTYSLEEYTSRYKIPTIARLDGTAEDFLNSQEGTFWKDTFAKSQVNNHAFTVISVDRIGYLAEFSLERARIAEGRDFTVEEQAGGSRVCIIHEALAQASGIGLGDTITLNLYATDYGLPYQSFRADGSGILNPSASFYSGNMPFDETAEFTVVGIWRGERHWHDVLDASEYACSPNTIFVPQASVQTPMETDGSILLNTVVMQNGKIEAFHELAMDSGYAGRFKYNDQGYSTIAANFHNYETLARQMLAVGSVVYAVLLLLFLLLYPGSQKKNVRTMQSFGAHFLRRFGHIMATSLGIVLPASLLGGWLGSQLWDSMVKALQTTAESAIALQIEPGTLTILAAAQLIFALLLTVCVAIFVAAPRGMSARK